MDLASVPWGTRRAIHFRGKMWMARQFHMSGLIAVGAISLGIIGALFDLLILMIDFELAATPRASLGLCCP